MKNILISSGILGILLCTPAFAAADPIQPVLNKVMLQLSAEQWVTTKTADTIVNIDATLTEDQLSQAHADILQKLNKLANADWHIIAFNRTPNESGMEQLEVQAEARLEEAALSDLRTQAKAMSKPGETFTIDSIDFTPTLAEMETGRNQLRTQIYNEIQNELAIINKTYPTQHYVVHEINFESQNPPISPQPMMMARVGFGGAANAPASQPVTVANKITLTADVTLVSVNQ